ncbi:NUDIX hydrolase (modular protein) [Candidatus Bipolaricaulis anaerobius]|uniref:NUDIX hydrolase (Modular protein) n=1 Tax=Candidatus Bipolaricaulis anaerobius TaxID=2026885 RepID=A0A2X3KIB3_9BACT|nr:NUDIX hydrolase (modular protein) [Candidatus Bipolaricaulis anaerobius]
MGAKASPVTSGSHIAFRGRAISVAVRATPAGRREVVLHPGAAAALVRDRAGRVLLVRQQREGAAGPLWEIPAGVLERGERPLAAAKRELLEETGLTARRWRYLGTVYPTPGYSTERTYLFLAGDPSGEPEARSEVDEVCFLTVAEVERLARSGAGDAKTLAALALAGESP